MAEGAAKLVLVTRADLPPGAQAVQAAHAMRQFAHLHPEVERAWFDRSNTLVLLTVPTEADLSRLVDRAVDREMLFAPFREEDLGGQLTAVALEPTQASQRLCRALPKALAG